MKILALLAALLLAACAAPQQQTPTKAVLPAAQFPDGIWMGSLEITPTQSDAPKEATPYKLALAACQGDVRVWYVRKDGLYDTPKSRFSVESRLGSYAVRFIDSEPVPDPSWVETQALMLIAMPEDDFQVQWSRSVSNRLKAAAEPKRFFFEHGIGVLKRVSDVCEPGRVYPPGTEAAP